MKKISLIVASLAGIALGISMAATDVAVSTTSQNAEISPIQMMSQNREMGISSNWGDRHSFDNRENLIERFAPAAFAGMLGAGIVFTILAILAIGFIIWMLVHAVRHDIDYKPVWILVIWFMNIFGAIIYYFSVVRPADCFCCYEEEDCEGCEDCDCEVAEDGTKICQGCGGENCNCSK